MAAVILLCGKVCSGKSTYSNKIKQDYNAVVLSCDELMLELFEEQLGDKHNIILQKVKDYFFQLAEKIVSTNTNVILDFGFWTRAERQETKLFFAKKRIDTQLHYIKVPYDTWLGNVQERNRSLLNGNKRSYFIDEDMMQLFSEEFEEPSIDEIDIVYDNRYM